MKTFKINTFTVILNRTVRTAVGMVAILALVAVAPMGLSHAKTTAEIEALSQTLSGTYLAARYASNKFDVKSGSIYFSKALEADPADKFLLEKGFEIMTANGEIDRALELARELVKQDPNNLLARIALGVEAIKNRSYTQASQEFSQIGDGPLGGLTRGILSAWTAYGMGNAEEAQRIITELKGANWFPLFTAYHLGLMLEQQNRFDEASAQFAISYDISRNNLRRVMAHARSLYRAGKYDEALQVLDDFNQVAADHPFIISIRQAMTQSQQVQTDILNTQDGIAEFLYGLSSAIDLEGGQNHVVIFLQLAIMLKPEMELSYFKLAEMFEKRAQYDEAIKYVSLVDPSSPLWRNAQIQIGRYHGIRDELDEARIILRQLVDQNPKDLEAALALGNLLRINEFYAEAAEIYDIAVNNLAEIESHHWQLYYYSGIANERIKNWVRAERDFLLALDLYPNRPEVLNYLGYSWVERGQNYARALEMITNAVQQRPNSSYIVDSLGWVYFRLGRYEEAVVELERAVNLKPEDPIMNDHLGDAYWKTGRKLEARFQWTHARDLDPEPEDLEYILHKLENGYAPREEVIDTTASTNVNVSETN